MDSWILCPCQRSRLPLLKRLLSSLQHPSDRVVVVTTQPNPIEIKDLDDIAGHRLLWPYEEHHIAKWWNLGLNYIASIARSNYEVLAISSDYVGTNYSVAMLGVFLRRHGLTMVGPNHWSGNAVYFGPDDERHATGRVPGGCWMLAGESGLRVDENFRWWYSDDDLEMQARQYSGTGILPGTGLVAEADTPLSAEKEQWAKEDRQKFIDKWKQEPW